MRWIQSLVVVTVTAMLFGCGGGGGGSLSPSASSNAGPGSTPAPSSTKVALQQITIHLKINPSATTSSTKRHAQYVSPATDGVLVQVYTSPESANPIPIGVSATDVSPGSAACGGATGTRTCTIYIPAPPGTDDFVFTTYDQPPVAGTTSFPANANILSIGEVTQTITLAGTNTVNAALGGVIASLSVMPLTQSLAGGTASNYNLAITAYDADSNAIVSGSTDPYNNPITVTATEIGGSGNTSVTLGGPTGTGTSSVTVAQSSQPVTVLYGGGGAAGYGVQIAVSSQGVTTVNASFAPFFVTSTSAYYTAATSSLAFTAPGQTSTINLAEYGYSGTFNAYPGACSGIATVSVPAAGANSSATVTAGANAGSCTVYFSDGTTTVPITVNAQYTSSTITIPLGTPGTIVEYPVPTSPSAPTSIVTGPDGNLWFADENGNSVGKITIYGNFTNYPIPTVGGNPFGITTGPDGKLWFTEIQGNKIGTISTAGAITEYTIPTTPAYDYEITTGPDGKLWFSEENTGKLGTITTSGVITEYYIGGGPYALTTGPDNNLWVNQYPISEIAKVQTSGTVLAEYGIPTSLAFPQGITTGPDGNLWFTEINGNKIGKLTTSGTLTEYPIPTANSSPDGIVAGPDGNLWFTEEGGAKIGRITTSGVFTEFPLPAVNGSPAGITVGPDGNLWFADQYGKIGKIIP